MALPLRVVLPYINHTDIAASVPQRVWFLRRFGLDLSMVFEGATGVYEPIRRFNSK